MTKTDWCGKLLKNSNNIYFPINKLGHGSYASVWMCYHKNKKQLLAIKIFKPIEHKSAEKEIRIYEKLNKLGISNTIKMHDNFVHDKHTCIVFDLMLGSVYDLLKKGGYYSGDEIVNFKNGLPLDFTMKITNSVLKTLKDLHNNNIIHGDIKPENILIYGRTPLHKEILCKLNLKTSDKKITEAIKDIYKNNIKNNSDSDSNSDSNSDSDCDSNSDSDSDKSNSCKSENTLLSDEPTVINLTETETDSNTEHDSNSDIDNNNNNNNICKHLLIDKKYMDEPIIAVSDMGSCIDLCGNKRPTSIHTKYYRAPEIILGLEYDGRSDMWALGCTIYELLTGKILFNPDNHDIDEKRFILNDIFNKLGKVPDKMIDSSPLKGVFFTKTNMLKTTLNTSPMSDIWKKLLLHIKSEKSIFWKKFQFVDFILDLLKIDPEERTSTKTLAKTRC